MMATRFPETVPLPTSAPSIPVMPDYSAFQYLFTIGEEGSAPGEFNWPRGLSVHKETGNFYVTDMLHHCIQIFSEGGQHISQFGYQHLNIPWGILTHQDNVYVTDCAKGSVFQFAQPDLTMVKRVGEKGSGGKQFAFPRQLAISPDQLLHVADEENHRIQILDCNLIFRGSLRHTTMTHPVDVKFSSGHMYVLSHQDNPCVHIFTLSGKKIRSIITRGDKEQQVGEAYFFCLDGGDNIMVADWRTHSVKVFSPEGDLLHNLGEEGHLPGYFHLPSSMSILNNVIIVIVSDNKTCALQIFYA